MVSPQEQNQKKNNLKTREINIADHSTASDAFIVSGGSVYSPLVARRNGHGTQHGASSLVRGLGQKVGFTLAPVDTNIDPVGPSAALSSA